jgi:hypothetical protein
MTLEVANSERFVSLHLPSGEDVSIDTRDWNVHIKLENNSEMRPSEAAEAFMTHIFPQYPKARVLYIAKKTVKQVEHAGLYSTYMREKSRDNSYTYRVQSFYGVAYCYRDVWGNNQKDNERVYTGGGGFITFGELKAIRMQVMKENDAKRERQYALMERQRAWGRQARIDFIDGMTEEEMRAALLLIATHQIKERTTELQHEGGTLNVIMREITGVRDEDMPKEFEEGLE